jgi:hypothetical protein
MIIYNPAFDIYHCIYRFLILLSTIEYDFIEFDKLRILDFYFVFPGEIKSISFPRRIIGSKKYFKEISSEFDSDLIRKKIFNKMENYQILAINCLSSINYINNKELSINNIVKKNKKYINGELLINFSDYAKNKEYLIDFLSNRLSQIELKGSNGLKFRTGLMETRYE